MEKRDASIVDRTPHAADLRLENITHSQTQKSDIQNINDIMYHFQNCGTVNLNIDSFNARGVRMENCHNNIPQVSCSSLPLTFVFSSNLAIYYSDHCSKILGNEKDEERSQFHAVTSGMWSFASSATKHVEYVLLP